MKRILWLLIGIAVVIIPAYLLLSQGLWQTDSGESADNAQERLMRLRMKLAVVAARNTIRCGYNRRQQRFIRPSQAVKTAILSLTASRKRNNETSDATPVIRFVEHRASGPWQVVFNYDDEIRFIRIEAYGRDTLKSIKRITVYCN